MPRVYLVGRTADVFLGLFTGVLAYGLYESKLDKRGERKEEDRLLNLVRWKREQWSKDKAVKHIEQEGWQELEKELKVEQEAK
ncbi:hypothetical protein JCM8547_000450 [Rhodosporidiobolus lusitaniae]